MVFLPSRPFQPSLMFVGKARSTWKVIHFCRIWPNSKQYTRLVRAARVKHSSLLWIFINYVWKSFIILGPRHRLFRVDGPHPLGPHALSKASIEKQCDSEIKILHQNEAAYWKVSLIGLYHPLYGVTNHKYKLSLNILCNVKKALAFNQDRCCHLALCLQLILFHW